MHCFDNRNELPAAFTIILKKMNLFIITTQNKSITCVLML